MSKWGKDEQGPKDGEDKGKKRERGENKNAIISSQTASEHIGLNQAIQFIKFTYTS